MSLQPWNIGALGVEQCVSNNISVGAVALASEGTVDVIVLPAGCLITRTVVEVAQAFNCGSPALSVGYNASADNLVPSASVNGGALGFNENGSPVLYKTAANTTVKAKLGRDGAIGTTGKANVYVFFTRVVAE
jgi:hypothetical protein